MDITDYIRVVSAVMVGNALSGVIIYVTWRSRRCEKRGISDSVLPGYLWFFAVIAFGFSIYGIWSLD